MTRVGTQDFKGYGTLDLSFTYSAPVEAVRPFVKVEWRNLFNNQKLIRWDTTINPDPTAATDELGLPTDFIRGPNFGQATSNAHYLLARTFLMSFGLRF